MSEGVGHNENHHGQWEHCAVVMCGREGNMNVRNACLDRMKSSAFDREENPVYYRLVEENDLSDVFTDEIIAIFQKCLDGLPRKSAARSCSAMWRG